MLKNERISFALSKYVMELSENQIESVIVQINDSGIKDKFYMVILEVNLNRDLLPKTNNYQYEEAVLEGKFLGGISSFFRMISPESGGLIKFSIMN